MIHRPRTWPEPVPLIDALLGDPARREPSARLCCVPRTVRVLTIITGIWLVLAPSIWGYGDTGGGFDALWNDVCAGLIVLAAGCAQLVRPTRARLLPIVVGIWLAIAPFALAYNLGPDPGPATVNDVIAGTLLTGATVSGYLNARDTTPWDGHREPSPD